MSASAIDLLTDFFTNSLPTSFLALGAPFVPAIALFAWAYSSNPAAETLVPRGCQKVGFVANHRRVSRKKQSKKQQVVSDEKRGRWRIRALVVYPIKSCFPVMLERGDVIPTGMRYDRQFSFAELVPVSKTDREKPKFPKGYKSNYHWKSITQREYPLLTKVKIEVWVPDEICLTYSAKEPNVANGGVLLVSFPDPNDDRFNITFQIPFNPCEARIKRMNYSEETVQIWVDFPKALNVTSEIPADVLAKLKEFLSSQRLRKLKNLALFRIDSNREKKQLREVYRGAPKKEEIGYQPVVGFADAYPLHLINMASLRDLETHVDPKNSQIDPLQFRANLYVEGPEAFAEERWKMVRIGAARYHVSSRTARCGLPNVNPYTGVRDQNEPWRAMNKYRKVDQGCPKVPCLGMQVTPMQPDGEIRVGDEIEMLETGEHFYLNWPEYA